MEVTASAQTAQWVGIAAESIIGIFQCILITWGIRAMKTSTERRGDQVQRDNEKSDGLMEALERQGKALEATAIRNS